MSAEEAPHPRYRVLFHIRQIGVGGIENALHGWLQALDRRRFSVDVSVAIPTDELAVYRQRLPDDVTVHTLLAPGPLVSLHQRRRDHRLSLGGRLALGLGMALQGRRAIHRRLRTLAGGYDLLIDFDLTLRKSVAAMPVPVVGVRHFAFWPRLTAKARRVGADLARYDGVAVLNPAMQAQARVLYGGALRAVFQLPNAFDLDAMRRQAVQDGPPEIDGDYVVCVARLDMRTKGLDLLLRAWARLRREQPGLACRLVLVGDGPDRAALHALASELGIGEHVVFMGVQRNPFRWMHTARALVLASRHEGSPNVLIEAMAMGCMVVSTDCPVGPRDLLDDGRIGLLVPVDDEAALAQALARALNDEELHRDSVVAGRRHAEGFGVAASNQRFLAMTRQLVKRQGSCQKGV